jgi:hypothetical protein
VHQAYEAKITSYTCNFYNVANNMYCTSKLQAMQDLQIGQCTHFNKML